MFILLRFGERSSPMAAAWLRAEPGGAALRVSDIALAHQKFMPVAKMHIHVIRTAAVMVPGQMDLVFLLRK